MFKELLEKSYFYYDGSTCSAAEMNESERIKISETLANFYKMSKMDQPTLEQLEEIYIILFNYSKTSIIDISQFKCYDAIKLYMEIEAEFKNQ